MNFLQGMILRLQSLGVLVVSTKGLDLLKRMSYPDHKLLCMVKVTGRHSRSVDYKFILFVEIYSFLPEKPQDKLVC